LRLSFPSKRSTDEAAVEIHEGGGVDGLMLRGGRQVGVLADEPASTTCAKKASKIGAAQSHLDRGDLVDADLDTLCTALYVRVDDELKMHPELGEVSPS
jgi:hypothetical protein